MRKRHVRHDSPATPPSADPASPSPSPNETGSAVDPDDSRGARPSKTQRKHEMHALQALGEKLVPLSAERLAKLPLPPELLEAIELAQRISSREGRRRQLQFIGKLMRRIDADAIRAALDAERDEEALRNALLQVAEGWRQRLLDDDDARAEFESRYGAEPGLGALIDTARRARLAGAGAAEAKKLFRRIFAHITAQTESERKDPA
ncbi:MAG: DUF615 domain-containing protein [Burkholderiaceae bacterium]|nr:DUF615 domain-containing protein [Burkholderiaceae bacterium]